MVRIVMLLSLGLAIGADSVDAADCPAQPLCFLDGSWHSDGTAFGKPALIMMRWQPALAGKFVRIDYRIVSRASGTPEQVFEGTGFYRRQKSGTYDGTWFDSQGAMHPLNAKVEGTALTTHWGVLGQTYGRTIYKLLAGRVEVIDAIQDKEGAWKEFSRNTLVRKE